LTALAFLACALIWSTTWFVIRLCIGPGGYPTFAAAALRFAMAAVIVAGLAALGLAGRGPRTLRQGAWVALGGLLCAISYGMVYAGETRISGGLAAVIFGTLPLVTAALTYLTGTERATRASLAGSAVALVGIGLIYRDRMEASAHQATGVAMLFGAVVACALYSIVLKRHTRDTDPLANNITFLAAAAVALGLYALAGERRPLPWPLPLRPTLALIYLGVLGSVVAFASYFYLLRRMTLTALSSLVFIEPVVALLIDAVWEKEIRLGPQTYAGAALTLVGVAVSLLVR
jgi:drug/metabolite transporter (DMT)-like permease